MDKLKPFAVPLVALALLLIWYFVVNPRLDDQPAAEGTKAEADGKAQSKAPAGSQ